MEERDYSNDTPENYVERRPYSGRVTIKAIPKRMNLLSVATDPAIADTNRSFLVFVVIILVFVFLNALRRN